MAIGAMHEQVRVQQVPEPRAALTSRGEAAVHLIRFEEVWAEVGGEDRGYFAATLEQPAREARVDR